MQESRLASCGRTMLCPLLDLQDQLCAGVDQSQELPFPIIIDSGASESVIPEDYVPHIPMEETALSRSKHAYVAANGEPIYNKGQKVL